MFIIFVLSMRRNKYYNLNNCFRNLCISIYVVVVIIICLNINKFEKMNEDILVLK